MKKIFLLLFLLFNYAITAQLDIYNSSTAINLNDSFLELNELITSCSFGGNIETANRLLSKIDKSSENYIIGKGTLFYNIEGKSKSFEFIESKKIRNDNKNYYKAFISLITNNIDDYFYFKNQIKNQILLTKLHVRSVIKRYYLRYEKKERVVKEVIEFLKFNKNINDDDKLFFQLFIIEFKDWEEDIKQFETIIKLYNENPERINKTRFLEYLKECNDTMCEEIKLNIQDKQIDLEKIDHLLDNFNENSEREIKKIIENSDYDKVNLKSYVFLFNENIRLRDIKLLLLINLNFKFSNYFLNFLKKGFNREISIQFIKDHKEMLLKELDIDISQNMLSTFKDEELLFFQGIINHLKILEKTINKSNKEIKYIKNAGYNDSKSWDNYINYLKNNPLHNEETIIEVNSEDEYKKVIELLKGFNQNNFHQNKLLLSFLLGNEKFFQLNNETAELILKNLIYLFSLNQEEGNSYSFKSSKNKLINYLAINSKLMDAVFKIDYKDPDKSLLKLLLSKLNSKKKEKIEKKLLSEISENPNNLNLKSILLKTLIINRKHKEFTTLYLNNINLYGKLSFPYEVKKNLKEIFNIEKLKKLLINAYNKTESKANLLSLIDLYKEVKMINEAKSIIKYRENRERVFY